MGLYQDRAYFEKIRDETFKKKEDGSSGWSAKAGYFYSLQDAKAYIQMSRDEEGRHFGWPQVIPIVWRKGELTQDDIETFPDFEEHA